ncbi:glutamate-rich protein 2 isoform X3 [Tiliqua scincoides]|uniref:glutamate-rich protein 2 isoform X3 n=1 Tax=Tiliqua scincoides TaxID=71010 RepID=UPI003462B00E
MNRFNLILGQAVPRAAAPKVSGTMEVIAPEDGFVLETCLPLSRHNSLGWTDAIKEPKNRQNGRLHVFGPKEAMVIEPIQTIPRLGCGNESSSRSYTPSKHILLNTPKSSLVKRNSLTKCVKDKNFTSSVRLPDCIEEEADAKEKISLNIEKASSSKVWIEAKEESIGKQNTDDEKPSDSSDDDDNGQDNDVQKQTAPLELMGEFLKAIMEQNYNLAKKLCQMILIYEPENPEAKQFLPLIEHKLLLESKQPDEEDEETGEESSDDSEEDTSSTDNDETDSEASSKDSDDND